MVSTLTSVPSAGLKFVWLGAIGTNRHRNAAAMSCKVTLIGRQTALGRSSQGPVGFPLASTVRRYTQYRYSFATPQLIIATLHGLFDPSGPLPKHVITYSYWYRGPERPWPPPGRPPDPTPTPTPPGPL